MLDTFYDCSNVTDLIIEDSNVELKLLRNGYDENGASIGLNFPRNIKHLHLGRNLNYYRIQNFVVTPFQERSKLVSVEISDQVTTINDHLFYGCSGLRQVIIPNSVGSIGKSAFIECTELQKAILGTSVASIGDFVFSGCTSLDTIVYCSNSSPDGWVATTHTYVLDPNKYSEPSSKVKSDYSIKGIITSKPASYSGKVPKLAYCCNIPEYTVSTQETSLNNKDVGTWTTNVDFHFEYKTHSFDATVPYTYAITPVDVFVRVDDEERIYGEENPQFKIHYQGFVNGEKENVLNTRASASIEANQRSVVGQYDINLSGASAKNYSFSYEKGQLTIKKAPLYVKINDISKNYGANNPDFSLYYDGLKNNEKQPEWISSPVMATTATKYSDVGEYPITAKNYDARNYTIGEVVEGTLSIEPISLNIRANNTSRLYFDENPSFDCTCEGFINNQTLANLTSQPVFSTSATKNSKVGSYLISVSGAKAKNYTISYETGTLNIQQRELKVSTPNYHRAYNEENPSVEIIYTGFVNNEGPSSLIQIPTATHTANKQSSVGTYPINLSGGSAINYWMSYKGGVLTINQAEQDLEWEQEITKAIVGDQIELLAKSSSNLEISYTLNNNIANTYKSGSKYYLDCTGVGVVRITAQQIGNINYYSTKKIVKTLTITDPTGVTSLVDKTKLKSGVWSLQGVKINDSSSDIQLAPGIYIINGKKVLVK